MRHINLIPKLSWYMAPLRVISSDGTETVSSTWILNEDGSHKYEFWLKEENEEFYYLSRSFNDGTEYVIEVFKDKFDIEDYK